MQSALQARIARIAMMVCALIVALGQVSHGQVEGSVESIGFEGFYRPGSWTRMIVVLRSGSAASGEYIVRVRQQDLDRDRVIFQRVISLTGTGEAGAQRLQRFEVYFRPQPTDRGLPDRFDNTNLTDLRNAVRVSLHDRNNRFITDLPIDSQVGSVEIPRSNFRRDARFVLVVTEGDYLPRAAEYAAVFGVLEDVNMVVVQPRVLPEHPLGYDGVDTVLWLNASPNELRAGGDDRFRALQSFVRRGGQLVIAQNQEWQSTLAFGDMLPVNIQEAVSARVYEPFRLMFSSPREPDSYDPLARFSDPITYVRATVKPGAVVEHWIQLPGGDAKDRAPFLVRAPYGTGQIAWLAMDPSSPAFRSILEGWSRVWDRVLGLNNDIIIPRPEVPAERTAIYGSQVSRFDLGQSLQGELELPGKGALLVALAVLFFILYWLIAGPGAYVFLATKKSAQLNWFMFALIAIAATVVTVIVVKLVLRGEPEIAHSTLVRGKPGEKTIVRSRIGLYIPRDGPQTLQVRDFTPDSPSFISAFDIHPAHLSRAPEKYGLEYTVSLREPGTAGPAELVMPFRSTLKKLEMEWTGSLGARIEGSAKLIERDLISGQITNVTGADLINVYVMFRGPLFTAVPTREMRTYDEYVLYIPQWPAGSTLDLGALYNRAGTETAPSTPYVNVEARLTPETGRVLRGTIRLHWQPYWNSKFVASSVVQQDALFDDRMQPVPASIPVLSVFSRLAPLRRDPGTGTLRSEIIRRNAREYDVSAALSAGSLIVVGMARSQPLPVPLFVEGEEVRGSGTVVYQFVLPMDQSLMEQQGTTAGSTTGPEN